MGYYKVSMTWAKHDDNSSATEITEKTCFLLRLLSHHYSRASIHFDFFWGGGEGGGGGGDNLPPKRVDCERLCETFALSRRLGPW